MSLAPSPLVIWSSPDGRRRVEVHVDGLDRAAVLLVDGELAAVVRLPRRAQALDSRRAKAPTTTTPTAPATICSSGGLLAASRTPPAAPAMTAGAMSGETRSA